MSHEFGGYVVLAMNAPEATSFKFCSCGWSGKRPELSDVKACDLTPGHASPAGRCPKCSELAYPDGELDRMMAHAEQACRLLETFVNLQVDMQAGKPFKRQSIEALLEESQELLKAVKRKKQTRRKTGDLLLEKNTQS